MRRWWEILRVSTKLGFTSFGGPVAHLGYFKSEYVDKRKWLSDKVYADIIALCQFLPGPASSQVGMAIGILRGGIIGGLLSFIGFTLPSILLLFLFAYFLQSGGFGNTGWIQGLKLVAVAVVAHAVMGMGKNLAPDRPRVTIAILAALVVLIWPTAWSQVAVILFAGVTGVFLYKNNKMVNIEELEMTVTKKAGIVSLALFFVLLVGLPIVSAFLKQPSIHIFDIFYRAGALVFGGGHIVLPLLEKELVPTGWMQAEDFLAGYGAAQAVPGPLFTFATYLGGMIGGIPTAVYATVAIFLPAFLLVVGTLPFLNEIRKRATIQSALTAINAAVVGILLAALYDPIWKSSIKSSLDFAIALGLFGLLAYWKLPAWMVVLLGAVIGFIIL